MELAAGTAVLGEGVVAGAAPAGRGPAGPRRSTNGAGSGLQRVCVILQRPELENLSCLRSGDRVKLYSALRPEIPTPSPPATA